MDPEKPAPLYYEVSPLTVRMLKLIGLLYCVIRLCLDFKLIRVWDLSVSKLLVHRARRFLQWEKMLSKAVPLRFFFSPRSFCVLVLLLLIFCFDFPTDALYSNIWNFDFSCISTKKHVQVQLARNLLPVCKNFRFLVTFPTPYPLPSLSSTLPLLYTVRSVQALSHSGILFSGVYKTRLHA